MGRLPAPKIRIETICRVNKSERVVKFLKGAEDNLMRVSDGKIAEISEIKTNELYEKI